jgi:hypothetical protein
MSLYGVSITAKAKAGSYWEKPIMWKAQAEIDSAPGDFIKSRLLGLTHSDCTPSLGCRASSWMIDGQYYRLLSVENDGGFVG